MARYKPNNPRDYLAVLDFINRAREQNKEIELTSALDKVREREGMMGVQLQGRMFDMGNYHALCNCVKEFAKQ